ncbi:RNA-binding domain-containing protein [Terfezia boudieri ATCC MYA-4762]|uniref:RNA-binding domain-containing protein n=1 Tax=Terfezia boudieri ATCC MYA-4762 TaxID=1051890 RepID=A0A3N4LDI7_9PEZI|nr:RNA-binding domain-containing protein [Terfezia boudieri ATCC MYA-4762]
MSYPPPPGLSSNNTSSAPASYSAPGTTTHSLPPRPSGPPPSFRAFNASTAASTQAASAPPASAFAFRPRQVAAPPNASHITHSAQPTTYSSGYSQSGYTGGVSYGAPGYGSAGNHPHAQAHAQYPAASAQYGQVPTISGAPHIVNPFPLPTQQTYGQGAAGFGGAAVGNAASRGRHNNQPYDPRYPPLDPETEAQIAQQQSIYIPADQQAHSASNKNGRTGGGITGSNNTALGPLNPAFGSGAAGGSISAGPTSEASTPLASSAPQPQSQAKEKQPTVIRSGGGQTWSDQTLLEWDPAHFRLFVGNLAGEVTDESLLKAFSKYPSVQKARVIRDKRTTKSKGFGFVSFSDGDEYFRAAREMNGKYIGSHPVLLKRSNTEIRPVIPGDRKKKGGPGGGGANLGVQNVGVKKKAKKNKVPERKVLG